MRGATTVGAVLAFALVATFVGACYDIDPLTNGQGPCVSAACDAGTETSVPAESGVTAPDAAVVCAPGDAATFKPQWRPPTGRAQKRCTLAQVDGFVSCLFAAAANDPSCREYLARADNAVCANCILSDYDDAAYGPLVRLDADRIIVNVEGCAALLTNDVAATGCPAKAQALSQCKRAVCVPYCPLTDNASLQALNKCEEDADNTSCKSFLQPSQCIVPLVSAGGAAQACTSGQTPLDAAKSLTAIFCAQ